MLYDAMGEHLEAMGTQGRCIVSISPFFVNHVSMSMVEDLVDRDLKVLYICVGRPHIFIRKFLAGKGIRAKDIHFMDISLSAKPGAEGNCRLTEKGEPLEVPAMFNLYRNDVEIKEVDISIVSTVILDNVSEMRVYNADDRVRSYLDFLKGIAERNGTGLRLIYFRRPGDPGAKDFAGSLGLDHLEIPDSVFR